MIYKTKNCHYTLPPFYKFYYKRFPLKEVNTFLKLLPFPQEYEYGPFGKKEYYYKLQKFGSVALKNNKALLRLATKSLNGVLQIFI